MKMDLVQSDGVRRLHHASSLDHGHTQLLQQGAHTILIVVVAQLVFANRIQQG